MANNNTVREIMEIVKLYANLDHCWDEVEEALNTYLDKHLTQRALNSIEKRLSDLEAARRDLGDMLRRCCDILGLKIL